MCKNMLALIDDDDALTHADVIVDFEIEIAGFTLPPDQLRDPQATYNPVNLAALIDISPLPWQTFFSAAGVIVNPLQGNVETKSYFSSLADLVQNTDLNTLKWYAKWHLVHSAADDLSDPFANESFRFYG